MKPYKYQKLHDINWLVGQLKTKTIRQIADEQGCTASAINYCVRKYRIKVPHRGEYRYSDKSSAVKEGLRNKFPDGRFGHLASNWKGGRRLTGQGHVYVYAPEHPNATKQGYVMEHRVVMEKHLGRYLGKDEDIHHIDGNKSNNKLENLKVLSRSEHTKLHQDAYKELIRLRKLLTENDINFS